MKFTKKNIIIFLLILFFVSATMFYKCNLLADAKTTSKFLMYAILGGLFVYDYKSKLIDRTSAETSFHVVDKCVLFLIIAQCVSIFNSFLYKDQPIKYGLLSSLPFFTTYLFYFWLRKSMLNISIIEKIIITMAFLSCAAKIISLLTMPSPIFGSFEYDLTRGGARFRIPGEEWIVCGFFYFINRYLKLRESKYLIVVSFLYLMLLSTLTRQVILWTTALGVWFVFSSLKLWKKIAFSVLASVLFAFVVPNIPFVKRMSEMTENQVGDGNYKEDVRYRDYQVFLFDYKRTPIQYAFGCGIPSEGRSKWGDEMIKMGEEQLIPVDVGWAGFVFLYGYIPAIVLLFIFIYSLRTPHADRYQYLKYYLVYIMLASILSGPILYYHQYLTVIFCFYAVRKSHYDVLRKNHLGKKILEYEYGINNPKLQQLRRYIKLLRQYR